MSHSRRFFVRVVSSALVAVSALGATQAGAQTAPAQATAPVPAQTPEAFIQSITNEVMATVKSDKAIQSGDLRKITAVVDAKIMPNVNFVRMTAAAVGPAWRRATPDQRQRLQNEFKTLLVHTYAGALRQVKNQSVEVLPLRGAPTDKEVVVRTLIRGQGDPVQVDYRMEKTPGQGAGWKIYDVNVVGVWLVDNYRPQFAQQINAGGVDALIRSLSERNQSNAASGKT